eukprot:104744-Pelagomonas_calceolata.AAC.1
MVWRVTTYALMSLQRSAWSLCRLQLLSRPRVFIVLDFDQVHMPLVYIQLVRLPQAVGCGGPQCGVVSAA